MLRVAPGSAKLGQGSVIPTRTERTDGPARWTEIRNIPFAKGWVDTVPHVQVAQVRVCV